MALQLQYFVNLWCALIELAVLRLDKVGGGGGGESVSYVRPRYARVYCITIPNFIQVLVFAFFFSWIIGLVFK